MNAAISFCFVSVFAGLPQGLLCLPLSSWFLGLFKGQPLLLSREGEGRPRQVDLWCCWGVDVSQERRDRGQLCVRELGDRVHEGGRVKGKWERLGACRGEDVCASGGMVQCMGEVQGESRGRGVSA